MTFKAMKTLVDPEFKQILLPFGSISMCITILTQENELISKQQFSALFVELKILKMRLKTLN